MTTFARWEDPRNARALNAVAAPEPSRLLKALGSMGEVPVRLDFECYYSKDFSLDKLTTEAFVRSPQFQTIGVGVKFGDHASVWLEEWQFREWVERVNWSRVALTAHHTQFDGLILSHHYNVRPGFLKCTMSMARALHGAGHVGLEHLGPRYGLGKKGDEVEQTKGKRREDFTQAQWLKFGDYCNNDVNLTAGLDDAMSPRMPLEELWLIDTTIRMFTEPVFEGDKDVLRNALAEERRRKSELFCRIAESAGVTAAPGVNVELAARKILGSGDKFAAVLMRHGVTPQKKANDKGHQIWAFAKDDAGMQELLEHPDEEIRSLAEARVEVKSNIVQSRTERVIGANERGRIPFYLKYCGAHTNRWSGGDKMNPQNFNRGGSLRAAIIVSKWGAREIAMVVGDSGQIEARVLPWLAGETSLIETFRKNDARAREGEEAAKRLGIEIANYWKKNGGEPDFYSDEGSRFFLKPISKKDTPKERQISKNMLLGLGFSMGTAKFATELLKGMLGSDPVQFTERDAETFGVDVSAFEGRSVGFEQKTTWGLRVETIRQAGFRLTYRAMLVHFAVADHFVRLYRSTNKRIAALWKTCDQILRVMEAQGGDPDAVRMSFMGLKIKRHAIEKPNGMTLHYPGLRKGRSGFTYMGGATGKKVTKIYGGLLTENLVQSLARDIVAEQALWVRARYANALQGQRNPLGTTTHDELVAVVPAEQATECLDFMINRMRIAPVWCRGLPLNAAGGFGVSYGAVK